MIQLEVPIQVSEGLPNGAFGGGLLRPEHSIMFRT